MPTRISFNGADNVGKTTQIKALKNHLGEKAFVIPPITQFSPDWQKVPGDFFWYFGNSEHKIWLKLMLDSLYTRNQFIQLCSADIVLIDRGVKMSLIYIAAALKVRMKLSSMTEARMLLADFISRNYEPIHDLEDILILLKQSHDQATNITTTIERCDFKNPQMSEIYTGYQRDLNYELETLTTDQCHTIIVNNKSIAEVSSEIRERLYKNI